MKKLLFSIILLANPVFGDASPGTSPLERVAARIEGSTITQWDLDYTRDRLNGQGDPETWLIVVARSRLGAAKAERAGLPDTSPEVKWRLWEREKSLAINTYLNERVQGASIEESAIRNYYEENETQFKQPAMFAFRYIFCDTTEAKSPARIEEIRRQISQTHAELVAAASPPGDPKGTLDTESFQEIGKSCPCSESGQVRFAGPFTWDEPIQETIKDAARKLEVGQFSPVLSTKYGFQILHLHDKQEEKVLREFDEVKDRIREILESRVKKEKIDAYFERLKRETDRYRIHRNQLERQLPGAHRTPPESPYVVEVGEWKWKPKPFQEFMTSVYRREWILSHKLDDAEALTWEKLVLPLLLYEEAEKAGIVDRPTQTAMWRYQRDQILTYYWVMATARRKTADLPEPTTEEYRAYYDANPEKFSFPKSFQFQILEAPLASASGELSTPAAKEFAYRVLEEKMKGLLNELIADASAPLELDTWRKEIPGLEEKTEWVFENRKFSKEVWESLSELETGRWLERVLRTPQGVQIVRVRKTQEAFTRPFDPSLATITVPVKEERYRRIVQETWDELEREAREKIRKEE